MVSYLLRSNHCSLWSPGNTNLIWITPKYMPKYLLNTSEHSPLHLCWLCALDQLWNVRQYHRIFWQDGNDQIRFSQSNILCHAIRIQSLEPGICILMEVWWDCHSGLRCFKQDVKCQVMTWCRMLITTATKSFKHLKSQHLWLQLRILSWS